MHRSIFYRNVRARDHTEIFLVSAVSSLLLLRFYLHLTHYPQVGGGSLHIAHMLYGGLLMAVAILLMLSYLGARVQRFAAFLGGIGFGIFIDELGKFITKDNNYFFRPTIGIIYAVFIALYLFINFLGRDRHLTEQEYELNALNLFEEAVLDDLDRHERAEIKRLLARADQDSPIVRALALSLKDVATTRAGKPNMLVRAASYAGRAYRRFWSRRFSSRLVSGLFVLEAVILLAAVIATLANNIDNVRDAFSLHAASHYSEKLIIGQLAASIISGIFVIAGAIKLASSRLEAFELFRRAMLVNIFLTEFFVFSRIQFGAIPGFLVSLGLLIALRYAIYEEHRGAATKA